jgi:hypothetical protein
VCRKKRVRRRRGSEGKGYLWRGLEEAGVELGLADAVEGERVEDSPWSGGGVTLER